MATKTITTSDLSGEHDAQTTIITVGDQTREVDLTAAEVDDIRERLADVLAVARPVTQPGSKRTAPETSPGWREGVRYWAQAAGYTVAPYGRLPKAVLADFAEVDPVIRRQANEQGHTVAKTGEIPEHVIRWYTEATYGEPEPAKD